MATSYPVILPNQVAFLTLYQCDHNIFHILSWANLESVMAKVFVRSPFPLDIPATAWLCSNLGKRRHILESCMFFFLHLYVLIPCSFGLRALGLHTKIWAKYNMSKTYHLSLPWTSTDSGFYQTVPPTCTKPYWWADWIWHSARIVLSIGSWKDSAVNSRHRGWTS